MEINAEDKITSMIEDIQRVLIEKQQKQLDEAEALLRDINVYFIYAAYDGSNGLRERIDAWLLNR
jgi:hypothetical protein